MTQHQQNNPRGGMQPPRGFPQGQGMARQQAPQGGMQIPQRGAFALSEVLPQIQQASAEMDRLRIEWMELRTKADYAKNHASQVRASLLVNLRVWGNDETGNMPIKTGVERKEWADADADVQQAELEADLAQTVQMGAREAYESAKGRFDAMRSALSMEKEMMSREYSGPHVGP